MQSILHRGAQQFNISLSDAQLNAFEQYSRELIAWNQRVNLTRIIEPEEITVKHFLDSLSVCLALSDRAAKPVGSDAGFSMVDVGSGAGFPGLPLKIALPNIQLTLVESTAKKTAFLQHIINTLQLHTVTVLTARAEDVGRQKKHREQYDVAVARAVSSLPVLAEYALPLVKVGGIFVAQKGQHPTEEVELAANAFKILGGQIEKILSVQVPGLEAARHLLVIKKNKAVPGLYPRRAGLPAKNPL